MLKNFSFQTKITILVIFIIALLAIVVTLFVVKQPLVKVTDSPAAIEAKSSYGLDLVTYNNGKTEIIYKDFDYSKIESGWVLRTEVDALPNGDPRFPSFMAPNVTFQGSTWHHAVYTYDDPGSMGCQRNILYINREAKSNETITKTHVPYCIWNTLDTNDINRFFAKSEDETKLIVGSYTDGSILSEIAAPDRMNSQAVSNWENTKLAFFSGQCDLGGDTFRIYIWDTKLGTVIDKRPTLNLRDCGQIAGGELVYNHDTDAFDVFDNNGDRTYLGSVK